MLEELGFELWIGDPAEIHTRRVRKQKTDRQDAELLLQLMIEGRFPPHLGAGLGEPQRAATGVTPASAGADANARWDSLEQPLVELPG